MNRTRASFVVLALACAAGCGSGARSATPPATTAPPATATATPPPAPAPTPLAPAPRAPPEANPFLQPSSLAFHLPPFDKITDADFAPAFEAGMAEQRKEIDAIAHDAVPPTFDNTI